jgi:hypothetical protein
MKRLPHQSGITGERLALIFFCRYINAGCTLRAQRPGKAAIGNCLRRGAGKSPLASKRIALFRMNTQAQNILFADEPPHMLRILHSVRRKRKSQGPYSIHGELL